jgi:protein phosphatase
MDTDDLEPRTNEFDVYGLTHQGKVREINQDHFLLCSLYKRLKIHATSLPKPELLRLRGERIAFLAVVADGVGGHQAGEEASRIALETIAHYITDTMQCYYTNDPDQETRFLEHLDESVLECHAQVVSEAKADPGRHGMATTLTLAIGHWPWAYVVQVGDSRCYQLRDGELSQITRDQTVAQEFLDQGILTPDEVKETNLDNILSSAIGGPRATPRTNRTSMRWNDVLLLCSDGLTRHVSDDRLREQLQKMESAKQVCHALVQDALDGGGEDNITVIVGRTKPAA